MRPGDAEDAERHLAEFDQRGGLWDIDARQGAGQPVDDAGLEVIANIGREIREAELGRVDEIAEERHRIPKDAFQRAAGLLDVAHQAGLHDVEDDLQQVPDRAKAPADEIRRDVDEDGADLDEGARDGHDVDEGQRLNGGDDLLRDGLNHGHQTAECVLEPGIGTRDGVALLDVLPDLFLADQLHEAAEQRFGGARHGFAGHRILAEDGAQEVVAARALGERGQWLQDRVLHHLQQFDGHFAAERDQPVDRLGEDAFGALPHAREVEDVLPTQRVDESLQRRHDVTADIAELRELRLDPGRGFVDDAVIVERQRYQSTAWDQLDQGAQDVRGAAIGRAHVDRVETHHQSEQPETGDVVGQLGELVERVLHAEALNRRRRGRGRDLLAVLRRMPLLDGVGQLVGEQELAFAAARLVLTAREEDVVLIGEGARTELV